MCMLAFTPRYRSSVVQAAVPLVRVRARGGLPEPGVEHGEGIVEQPPGAAEPRDRTGRGGEHHERVRVGAATRGQWTLYWRDRNLAFHRYTRIGPSPDVAVLLAEIEADPAGIFWG